MAVTSWVTTHPAGKTIWWAMTYRWRCKNPQCHSANLEHRFQSVTKESEVWCWACGLSADKFEHRFRQGELAETVCEKCQTPTDRERRLRLCTYKETVCLDCHASFVGQDENHGSLENKSLYWLEITVVAYHIKMVAVRDPADFPKIMSALERGESVE